jgi:hypothetical protein
MISGFGIGYFVLRGAGWIGSRSEFEFGRGLPGGF